MPRRARGGGGRPPAPAPPPPGPGARRGRDADRAGHSRAAEPAVAARVLGEILLVVVLGEVERPGLDDLRRDRPVAARFQRLAVGALGRLRRPALGFVEDVDPRTVLR